jgi:hypothetical protein
MRISGGVGLAGLERRDALFELEAAVIQAVHLSDGLRPVDAAQGEQKAPGTTDDEAIDPSQAAADDVVRRAVQSEPDRPPACGRVQCGCERAVCRSGARLTDDPHGEGAVAPSSSLPARAALRCGGGRRHGADATGVLGERPTG